MKIFLEYDQAELDRQFDHTAWIPNTADLISRYGEKSDDVRRRHGEPRSFAYGPSAAETLDLYRADQSGGPVHVFIHGGAWRNLSKRESAFPADAFLAAGVHFAAIDFGAVPGVTLDQMASQVRCAVAWLYRQGNSLGIDCHRITVSGHSSGAHLAALAAVTHWADYDLPADTLKGVLCISGIYDLEPVRLSARNDYMHLDHDMVQALSPIRHVNRLGCKITIASGDRESDEFRRQAKSFADAVDSNGQFIECAGLNHFETGHALAHPDHALGRAALALASK